MSDALPRDDVSALTERSVRIAVAEGGDVTPRVLVRAAISERDDFTAAGGTAEVDWRARAVLRAARLWAQEQKRQAVVEDVLLACYVQGEPDTVAALGSRRAYVEQLAQAAGLSRGGDLPGPELPGTADVPPIPLDRLPDKVHRAFEEELSRVRQALANGSAIEDVWAQSRAWLASLQGFEEEERSSLRAHVLAGFEHMARGAVPPVPFWTDGRAQPGRPLRHP